MRFDPMTAARPAWGMLLLMVTTLIVPSVLVASDKTEPAQAPTTPGFMGFRFSYSQGALEVVNLYPGGPAERAGLKVRDRVVAVNGVKFRFSSELEMRGAFDWVTIGEAVELTVERGGTTEAIDLVPSEMPKAIARQNREELQVGLLRQGNTTLQRILDEAKTLIVEKLDDRSVNLMIEGSSTPQDDVLEILQRQHRIFRERTAEMKPGDRLRLKISKNPGLGWSLVFIRPDTDATKH